MVNFAARDKSIAYRITLGAVGYTSRPSSAVGRHAYAPVRTGHPRQRSPLTAPSFSDGQVAQLVEQRTENPCVGGSIPPLATNTLSECDAPRGCDNHSMSKSAGAARFHADGFDVAVVGGGVVGLAAALGCAQCGLTVALVAPQRAPASGGSNVTGARAVASGSFDP